MRKYVWLVLAATVPFVTACGDTRLLGDRAIPDEMMVVEGPPLSLPPNFNLRPPRKGEAASVLDGGATAQQILTGTPAAAADGTAAVPDWLLQQAGAEKIDPDIRSKLEAEQQAEPKQGFWNRLTGGSEQQDAVDAE